jgi:hypothetical protein
MQQLKSFLIFIILIASSAIHGQTFEKRIDLDIPMVQSSVALSTTGEFFLSGLAVSPDTENPILLKTDSAGTVLWCESISPPSSVASIQLYSLCATSDGGCVGFGDATIGTWMVKVKPTGQIEWNVMYGSPGNNGASSVIRIRDGGYVFVGEGGQFEPDASITKTDSLGVAKWSTLVTSTHTYSFASSVIELEDSSLLVAGVDFVGKSKLPFLLKLRSDGSPVWRHRINTAIDRYPGLVLTKDSGAVLCSSRIRSDNDFYFVKFNSNGGIVWEKTVDAFGGESVSSLIELSDGSLVACGARDGRLAIISLRPDGGLKYVKVLVTTFDFLEGNSIVKTKGGGFVVSGDGRDATRPLIICKFDSLGNNCNTEDLLLSGNDGTGIISDSSIVQSKGPVLVSKETASVKSISFSGGDFCLPTSVRGNISVKQNSISIRPNPVHKESLIISLKQSMVVDYILTLHDPLGKEVYHEQKFLTGTEETITLQVSDLPSGIYTVELLDANTFASVWRGKVVKVN